MITLILLILLTLIGLLLSVAYLTYAERKIIAAMQLRKGPNVVGPYGLLQPIADGLKLFFKEMIFPTQAHQAIFILAPLITFGFSLASWAVIPLSAHHVFSNINVGILYLLATSSLGVYGIIMAGWASASTYALLGALRSAAQMISYELSIGFVVVGILLSSESCNLTQIVLAQEKIWFVVPLFPLFLIFLIAAFAETNRHPFDLPEAESELVAGYHVEYASFPFALFFLGEYANMILMSAVGTLLFLGGWLAPFKMLSFIPGPIWFALKVAFLLFLFIWVRASFPRYRYDQLMTLGWKILLPVSLGSVMIIAIVVKIL